MVPYDKNPLFVGRDSLLRDLREKLQETKPKKYQHRIAISGMGGVGKTQVAIEYSNRYRDDYSAIYWISAVNQAALLSGFRGIATETKCLPAGSEELTAVKEAQKVLSWLQLQKNWLLVIDNLDDVSVADGFLPRMDTGHTLITTRNPDAKRIPAEGFEIRELSQFEAVELLVISSELSEIDFPTLRKDATTVVDELRCLPLAIDQAAALIRSSRISINTFLNLYRNSRKEVLQEKSGSKHIYPNSVAATFLLSMDRLKETKYGTQATKLLHLFVFLNPDGILIEFLQAGRDGSEELRQLMENEFVFNRSVAMLVELSLVRRSQKEDSIILHRLIQAVVQDELEDDTLRHCSAQVIDICSAAFPNTWENKESRERCRLFESQAVNSAFEAARLVKCKKAGDTLYHLGSFLLDDGKFQDSERLFKRCQGLFGRLMGTEHQETLKSTNYLASTYRAQGKMQNAAALHEQVLEARKRTLGEEHPDTLQSMSNLASTYWAQGKLQDAAALHEQVLEARKRTPGEEHPDTLRSMNNLASTYRDQGKLQDAAALNEKVLEARKRTLGEEHPDTLTSMNNMAEIYRHQGRMQDAAALNEKVLEARKRTLGDEHPHTLLGMNNLAATYSTQGKILDAAVLFEKVLEAKKRMLGEEHPDTLRAMNNLAETYWAQGNILAAAALHEKVLELSKRTLGEEHPHTFISMNNLALTYNDLSRTMEAIDLMQQSVDGSRKVLGDDHPDTVNRKQWLVEWKSLPVDSVNLNTP